jgi:hypothetical protein
MSPGVFRIFADLIQQHLRESPFPWYSNWSRNTQSSMVFIPRQLQVPKIDENFDFYLFLQYGLDFLKIKRGTDWVPLDFKTHPIK